MLGIAASTSMNDVSGRRTRRRRVLGHEQRGADRDRHREHDRDDRDEERAQQRRPHAELPGFGGPQRFREERPAGRVQRVPRPDHEEEPDQGHERERQHPAGPRADPVDLVGGRSAAGGPNPFLGLFGNRESHALHCHALAPTPVRGPGARNRRAPSLIRVGRGRREMAGRVNDRGTTSDKSATASDARRTR